MRQAGVIRNTMAIDRVESKFRVRLEMIEERLGKMILQSDKPTHPECIEDAIQQMIRSLGLNEKTMRESAVHICSSRLNCLECYPLKGCRSRV